MSRPKLEGAILTTTRGTTRHVTAQSAAWSNLEKYEASHMTFPLGRNPFAGTLKLYEVANGSYVQPDGTDEVFLFHRPDGLFSVCTDKDGNLVHLYINHEVKIMKGF
jgi:hypothetical protein